MASRAARLLERSYAAGLLLTLLASPVFHPLAPRRFMQLLAIVALSPAARIVVHASEHVRVAEFGALLAVLILDRLGLAIAGLPAVNRATLLVNLGIGLGLTLWVARRQQPQAFPAHLRRVASIAAGVLSLALLAEIGGWTNLAALIAAGVTVGARSFAARRSLRRLHAGALLRLLARVLVRARGGRRAARTGRDHARWLGDRHESLGHPRSERRRGRGAERRPGFQCSVLPLTSRLGLAVHRALSEAEITIPFPQRDLHLASISPAARAVLSDTARKV